MQTINRVATRDVPRHTDPLGEMLYLIRLNGALYCQSELTSPWGIEMPAMTGKMMFHIVLHGECWLNSGDKSIQLSAGSLALLPSGLGHTISSDQHQNAVPLFDITIQQISDRYELMEFGGGGDYTQLACGVISFDHVAGAKLIEQLPSQIHIPSAEAESNLQLSTTLQLLQAEAASLNTGGETVMAHLADIIVIQAIRHWLETAEEAQTGWIAALKDPKIGKALSAMHEQPSEPWTVDSLASIAGMSRSGFTAKFTEQTGNSVKQYLTEWRMSLARMRLQHESLPLGQLAEELGYQSEAAFSRAYKRIMGESPVRHQR